MYKTPPQYDDKLTLIEMWKRYMKNGALIHGYMMGCDVDMDIVVAHYTRSEAELKSRIKKFWNHIQTLERRFSKKKGIDKYLKQRDRTEQIDTRIRNFVLQHIQAVSDNTFIKSNA